METLMRKMLPLLVAVALLVPISLVHAQQVQQQKHLDIYFIDTEGGQATLFVSPSGQSMLVDTGFPGNQGAATPAEASAPAIMRVTRPSSPIESPSGISWITVPIWWSCSRIGLRPICPISRCAKGLTPSFRNPVTRFPLQVLTCKLCPLRATCLPSQWWARRVRARLTRFAETPS